MKFIVDQPVSPNVALWLRESGFDAFHLRERGLSRMKDVEIFSLAVKEDRILITTDIDFSRILALSGRADPGLILFRAGNISDQEMLRLMKDVLKQVDHTELPVSVITVELHAFRLRRLPLLPNTPTEQR